MITKHRYDSIEELVITGGSFEEVQEAVMELFEKYPEQVYGTTLVQEPFETLSGAWKASIRRWTHNDLWQD